MRVACAAEVRESEGVRHCLPWLGVGLVLVLVACDHKPAPKKQPIVAKAVMSAPAPVGAPAPGTAAAPTAPAVKLTPAPAGGADGVAAEACLQIGIRIADLAIASATDAMKAQLEQARTDIVRSSAEACTKGAWDAEVRGCFLTAKTLQDLDACKLRVPPTPPTPPAARPTP